MVSRVQRLIRRPPAICADGAMAAGPIRYAPGGLIVWAIRLSTTNDA
jgi:hypothetical protein